MCLISIFVSNSLLRSILVRCNKAVLYNDVCDLIFSAELEKIKKKKKKKGTYRTNIIN